MAADATTVIVGLDIGTTGVKAIAVAPDGEVVGARRARVSALDAAGRLVGAESRGLVARDEGRDRGARAARDRRDRPLGPDARPRRARRSRAGRPARDPLERPAHGRRVRRDRGAHRARAADRAHRQPGADGLHGAEAPLAPPPRAARRTAGSHGSCCRRTTCGCGSRASGRPTSPTRRARSCSTSPAARWSTEVLDALDLDPSILPPLLESPEVSGTTIACDDLSPGIPGCGGRGGLRRGGARGRDRPAGAALDRDGHVGRRVRGAARVRERPAGARARVLPRRAGPVARDGRDALGRGLAAVAARPARPGRVRSPTSSPRPRPGSPASTGFSSRPTSPASGRRTPTRPRARRSRVSSSATTAAHSCAPCSRASRSACATRSSSSASSVARATGRVPRAGARGGCGSSIVASVLGLPIELTAVEEGLGLRGRAARGRRRRRLRRRARTPSTAASACGRRSSPTPPGRQSTRRRMRASARCIPALDTVKEQAG